MFLEVIFLKHYVLFYSFQNSPYFELTDIACLWKCDAIIAKEEKVFVKLLFVQIGNM